MRSIVAFVFAIGCGAASPQEPAQPAGEEVVFEITMTSGGPPLPGICSVRKTTLYRSGRLVESNCDDKHEAGVVPPSRMSAFFRRARDAEDTKRDPQECCDLPNVGCRAWTRGDLREIKSGKACIDLEELARPR